MTFREYLEYFRDALWAFSKRKFTFSEDSVWRSIGEAVASIAVKNDAAVRNIELRTSLVDAFGEDLDALAANYRIYRKVDSVATGSVNIWRSSLPSASIFIPSGTVVSDQLGRTFITVENSVIPSDINYYPTNILGLIGSRYYALPLSSELTSFETSGLTDEEIASQLVSTNEVKIEASEAGVDYNTREHEIVTINSGAALSVDNMYGISGGANVETDEQFRERIFETIRGANSKFSKSALIAYLLSLDGVIDATIIDDYECLPIEAPPVGHVLAVINSTLASGTNSQPASYIVDGLPRNIYQRVRNLIEEEMRRPCGIGITVAEADVREVDFTSDYGDYIQIVVSNSSQASTKRTELQTLLYDYFLSLKIGDSVRKSDIIKVLKSDEDVVDVNDFEFVSITSYDSGGAPISTEVETLSASLNTVFRVKNPSNISMNIRLEG